MSNIDQQLAFTPDEAGVVSGRSRSRVYLAIKNRELVARKDGRATIIEREELLRWIKSFPVHDPAAGSAWSRHRRLHGSKRGLESLSECATLRGECLRCV